MTRRLCVAAACALVLVGAVGGCGGSSQPKTGPTPALSVAQIKQLNKIDAARTLAECKRAANNPGLQAVLKPLMDAQCQFIKTGNNAGLHKIDRRICRVSARLQPEPQRSTLLAQCKTL